MQEDRDGLGENWRAARPPSSSPQPGQRERVAARRRSAPNVFTQCARDEAGGSGCCRTSRGERQLPRFCGSRERELERRGAENLCFLFGLRGRSHSGSHAAVPSLSIQLSVFTPLLLERLPAATLGLFFLLPPLPHSPGVDLN